MFVINRYTIFPCIALFYCVRKDFGDISDYEREYTISTLRSLSRGNPRSNVCNDMLECFGILDVGVDCLLESYLIAFIKCQYTNNLPPHWLIKNLNGSPITPCVPSIAFHSSARLKSFFCGILKEKWLCQGLIILLFKDDLACIEMHVRSWHFFISLFRSISLYDVRWIKGEDSFS